MNKNPIVDEYLEKINHPLTEEIQLVREIILSTDKDIEETIKWNSPTFMYKGNMASYFMNAKKHVSLMFHKGALINDKTGLLKGDGKEARTAKFENIEDIKKRKKDLQLVVKEYMKLQNQK
ncbi:MAG: DUF1801 domain-containing protein [Lewinellaceae bacterium]|nr:DUF1801 domain-containing protein [Lewinellaceae bacterium]